MDDQSSPQSQHLRQQRIDAKNGQGVGGLESNKMGAGRALLILSVDHNASNLITSPRTYNGSCRNGSGV